MTNRQLADKIVSLANECEEEHPLVAGTLFHLSGSVIAGPEFMRHTFDMNVQLSRKFIRFMELIKL